jgi:hypothetical protein
MPFDLRRGRQASKARIYICYRHSSIVLKANLADPSKASVPFFSLGAIRKNSRHNTAT